jgi:membrane protease YdiL (CAAX protease family)
MYTAIAVSLICAFYIAVENWQKVLRPRANSAQSAPHALERNIFLLQSQMILVQAVSTAGKDSSLLRRYAHEWLSLRPETPPVGQPVLEYSRVLKQWIMARVLGLQREAASLEGYLFVLWPMLSSQMQLETLELYQPLQNGAQPSSVLDLGWFALLWQDTRAGISLPSPQSDSYQLALTGSFKLMLMGGIMLAVGLAALLAAIFFYPFMLKRLRNLPDSYAGLPAHLGWETVAFYLLIMLLAGQGFGWFQSAVPLSASALFLPFAMVLGLCQAAVLSWPLWCGVPWRAYWQTLGLSRLPRRAGLKSLGLGLMALLASLPLVYLAFALVFLVAQGLGFDPAQGAHPLFPLLSEHPQWWTYLPAFLLAVVLAPVVEETLFRGVLYSALEQNFSRQAAILGSSLVFALLHPQGPVGLLPLAIIGAMLAVVRAITGSLWPCVFMHACLNAGVLALSRLLF